MQLLIRFLAGGISVSFFAVFSDIVKPKSFAGLFAAAPSVALATLALAVVSNGKSYAALEARSMIAGAIAFGVYTVLCSRLMMKNKLPAKAVSISGLSLWFACAIAGWLLFLRRP